MVLVQEIHLETESEAWDLLRRLVEREVSLEQMPQLSLGDWAKIDVYIPAEQYDSALTPYMMSGWVELQRSVYRAYSIATTGEADAKSLSEAEKEKLELVVKVKSGSSDQTVDVQKILESIASQLVDKMEPTHITIVLVTLILTWGGSSVVKSWLSGRKEQKLAEIELLKTQSIVKAQTAALETIVEVSGADKEHRNLLRRAAETVPIVSEIEIEADRGREALVKHVTKGDAKVNGVAIKSEAGQSITSRTRVEAQDVRLDGIYKIRKVDTTVATGFRVHVADPKGRELVGDVAEVMTTLDDRKVIQEAEWSKAPLFLQINAKERRGEISDAIVLRARAYSPDTDGDWS